MAEVALLGTGLMGTGMGACLLGAGHRVRVWNRTAARTAALVHAGAHAAPTPAQAAAGAEFILAALGDDGASRVAWTGDEGALAAPVAAGAIAIETSTLSAGWIDTLATRAGEAGLDFLDCPVTGGPDGARAGTLTVLAGGEAPVLERARAVLAAIGRQIVHFGPAGAGMRYKLIVNLIASVQAAALAEGLLAADRAGLDPAQVAAALQQGSVASPLLRYLAPRLLGAAEGAHEEVYFALRWRAKDARYGCALAAAVAAPSATGEAAAALFEAALGAGAGDRNESAVMEFLQQRAGASAGAKVIPDE